MRKFIRDETGAALIVEATIIYPVVFLCVFFLIFVGLFFMQNAMLESSAQKMAVLAAKEVAYPGFLKLTSSEDLTYANGAIEAAKGLVPENVAGVKTVGEVKAHPYRYWSSDPLSSDAKNTIKQLIVNNDDIKFLIGSSDIEAQISCSNYVIAQYVTVTITQKVIDIGILGFFGIDAPTLKATAVAPVNDADEFVRNMDFAKDAVNWLASKLGVDVSKIRSTIDSALSKVGLKE